MAFMANAKKLGASLATKAKALRHNLSEIEVKTLEATNEDPWGPHGSAMAEIAQAANDPHKYSLIMRVIEQRLMESPENWRLVYKALLLLEYLCKQGPIQVATDLAAESQTLASLQDNFDYKDPQGRDQGINVRNRAKELLFLVSDPRGLQDARERAARNAGKFTGVSSSEMRGGGVSFQGISSAINSGVGGLKNVGENLKETFTGLAVPKMANALSTVKEVAHNPKQLFRTSDPEARSLTYAAGLRDASAPAAAPSAAASDADAMEATRLRIERLRADGGIPDSSYGDVGGSGGYGAQEEAKKAPKKLSDIAVNPKIAATFGNLGTFAIGKPPSAPPRPTAAAPAPALPQPSLPLPTNIGSSIRGSLLPPVVPAAPAAAAMPAPAPMPAAGPSSAAAFDPEFDPFGDASAGGGGTPQAEEFDPFASLAGETHGAGHAAVGAEAAAPKAKGQDPFADLLA